MNIKNIPLGMKKSCRMFKNLMEEIKKYHQMINSIESDLKLIDNERLHEQTKSDRLDIQALASRLEGAVESFESLFSPLELALKRYVGWKAKTSKH